MRYIAFICGFLLIIFSLLLWVFYGKSSGDHGGGYVFVGIAGAFMCGWSLEVYEKLKQIK
jgi:hypothetical protein